MLTFDHGTIETADQMIKAAEKIERRAIAEVNSGQAGRGDIFVHAMFEDARELRAMAAADVADSNAAVAVI